MLLTDYFPQADEIWENLPKKEKLCPVWENMYKAEERKEKFKKQSVGGPDQFGAAHGALRQAPVPYRANDPIRSSNDLDE